MISSDDLTNNVKDSHQEANTTQPTITAVFRLLREVQDGQANLDLMPWTLDSRANSQVLILALQRCLRR